MKKTPLSALSLAVLAGGGVVASPAFADIQFQPDPCVITLEPSYVLTDGPIPVPGSVVTCPPQFTGFDPTGASVSMNILFSEQGATGNTNTHAQVSSSDVTAYDPAANALVTTRRLLLNGPAGTYTQVDTAETGNMYITDTTPNPDTYYRVVLARPFTIIDGLPATPTCTLTLSPTYTYVWGQGQGNRYPVPDSAISCTGGVTYNSRDYAASGAFDSRYANQAGLEVQGNPVFNPTTKTFTPSRQLWLIPGSMGNNWQAPAERREMGIAPGGQDSDEPFGRFTANPSGLTVTKTASNTRYALTLAAPFTIKRRTDVTATATRTKRGRLAINISADRNASFRNTTAPTYRRQTVLPDTRADHAVVRRGTTVLARVKLTPYGKGSVTVRDITGRNPYTVTMVATDDNYEGVARFVR